MLSQDRDQNATLRRAFVTYLAQAARHRLSMRIWRHRERDDEAEQPAWVAAKPVWSAVHIDAPKAGELVRHEDEHLPHAAA